MSEHRFEPLDFRSEELDESLHREDWIAPLGEESNLRKPERTFEPGFYGTRIEPPEPEPEEDEEAAEDEVAAPEDGGAPPPSEAEWRQALEEAKEQARQEGYEEGYEQGQLEGREKGEEEGRAAMERVQSTMLDSFQEALDSLLAGHPQVRDDWQQPLARLVKAIAERVLHKALEQHLEDYLERLVQTGLEYLAYESEIHVTLGEVTPGVAEELRSRLDNGGYGHVHVHVDDSRPAHAVRMETHYGIVDTSLEEQLDQVVSEALDGLSSEGGAS